MNDLKVLLGLSVFLENNHMNQIFLTFQFVPIIFFALKFHCKKNQVFHKYFFNKSISNRPEMFCKKGVLTNFANFTGKHLCQILFFNKVSGLRTAILLKMRLRHRCFPVNFVKFLRTLFFSQNISGCCFCKSDQIHRKLISKLFTYTMLFHKKLNNNQCQCPYWENKRKGTITRSYQHYKQLSQNFVSRK